MGICVGNWDPCFSQDVVVFGLSHGIDPSHLAYENRPLSTHHCIINETLALHLSLILVTK